MIISVLQAPGQSSVDVYLPPGDTFVDIWTGRLCVVMLPGIARFSRTMQLWSLIMNSVVIITVSSLYDTDTDTDTPTHTLACSTARQIRNEYTAA